MNTNTLRDVSGKRGPSLLSGLIILLVIIAGSANAQSPIDSARQLLDQKKYKSAFLLLKDHDPRNNDPEMVAEKTKILTRYFVTSLNHQMFALKDLEENETVHDYRGETGDFEMHIFDPDSITRRLIKKFPEDHRLYKNMADYWFEVYLNYNDNAAGRKSPLDSVKKYAQLAIEKGADDYDTYYKLAFSYTVNEAYHQAIPFFSKSIKRNDTFPASHYNLAYCFLYTNQRSNALLHATKAFRLYEDSLQKADAARMAGISLLEMDRPEKAMSFFRQSLNYSPQNLSSLLNMLQAGFLMNNSTKADSIAEEIFDLSPANPGIVNRLYRIFAQEDKTDQFVNLMKRQLEKYPGQIEIRGNIWFVLAKATMKEKPEKSKKYLRKARDNFKEVYPESHSVFDVINQALEHLQKKDVKSSEE